MAIKEDYRIRKTKRALASALFVLLSEKSLDDITVMELCDRAEIRRTTFYKHYRDKYDYIASFSRMLRAKFDAIYNVDSVGISVDYFSEYAKQMILFIAQHEKFVDNIFESSAFPAVLSALSAQNYADTYRNLETYIAGGGVVHNSPDVIACVAVGGVSGAIQMWLESGRKRPAEELAEELAELIRKLFV